jgi:hypothetical protein
MHTPAGESVHNPIGTAPAANAALNQRLPALAVFLVTVGVLTVAYVLTPNTRDGVGTHKALGLPPCGLYEATGIPCATCGMTTSFSLAAHGHLEAAFINQPAGAILALLTAMTVVVSGYALVTGMSLAPIGLMLWRPRIVIVGLAIVLAAWVYKIVVLTGWFGAST